MDLDKDDAHHVSMLLVAPEGVVGVAYCGSFGLFEKIFLQRREI